MARLFSVIAFVLAALLAPPSLADEGIQIHCANCAPDAPSVTVTGDIPYGAWVSSDRIIINPMLLAQAMQAPSVSGTYSPTGPSTSVITPGPVITTGCGVGGQSPCTSALPAGPSVIDCSVVQCINSKGEPVISTGTLTGKILTWLTAAFGTTIATVLTTLLVRMLKQAGVETAKGFSDNLQRIIVNGLNLGAAAAGATLKDKGNIAIKNQVIASAVQYTQAHASETIKALGLDPQSGRAVEAIKARIETAISDPAAPTPPALDPVGTPAKVAPAVAPSTIDTTKVT